MKESEIQQTIAGWLDLLGILWFASQNGLYSNPRAVMNAKKAGLKKGVPDLFICEPRKVKGVYYAGLFVELKTAKGRHSQEQVEWINALNKKGYYACFAHGLDDAMSRIGRYLNG